MMLSAAGLVGGEKGQCAETCIFSVRNKALKHAAAFSKTCLPPHPHRTIREPSEVTMQPCATQEKKWSCLLIGILQLVSHPHAHPITQSPPPQTSQKEPINQSNIAIIHSLPVQIGRFLACMSVTRLLFPGGLGLVFRP